MTRNVGMLDRVLRLGLAVILGALCFVNPNGILDDTLFLSLALIVSTVMLVVSIVGFCPIYKIFGWNT